MSGFHKDVILQDGAPTQLFLAKHCEFLHSYAKNQDSYEYVMSVWLRASGVYWCLTALKLLNDNELSDNDLFDFVMSCYDEEKGGFGASDNHDPHLLYTLSCVQILAMIDRLSDLDRDNVVKFVVNLQQSDGSFYGDEWGEVDTRFTFCAFATLALLNRLDQCNVQSGVQFILQCRNFDGAFGCVPGSESHAGQVFCCVGALSIANKLGLIEVDQLAWWLCERQLPSGGLNGRPEKLPDVCYSWWVLASLSIIGKAHWLDKDSLVKFILASQDEESGGFADRPGDMVDPFHTLFGLAGLSLLGESSLNKVNPVLCLPQSLVDKLGLKLEMAPSNM